MGREVPEVERRFVQKYIVRQRRERFLFELENYPRKALWRFAHTGFDLIKKEFVYPFKPTGVQDIYARMLAQGADPGPAHLLACEEEDLPLFQALERCYLWGTILLLARNADVVYYEDEPNPRSDKYLLY